MSPSEPSHPPRLPEPLALAAIVAAVVVCSGAFAAPGTGAAVDEPAAATADVRAAETAADAGRPTTTPVASNGRTDAELVAAYPNPVARDDPGEFVAVRFPAPTDAGGWTLTDGKTTVRLPNRTFEGVIAVSTTPAAARNHTDHPVVEPEGRLRLADAGDRLELRRGNRTVDSARYRDAPESRIRDFEVDAWRPVGATDRSPVRTGGSEATAFVLPDAPEATVEALGSAEERLLLAGYTLTSERVTEALLAAHDVGAGVSVLLDGAPVGGISEREARRLDRLVAAGVEVRLLAGPHARYRHHHPKYAVVDDRALVLTENFKPAGTGGMSSRGWGVVVDDPALAGALADLHRADREWRAATPWREYREGRDFGAPDPAVGDYEARHPPERVAVDAATLLVAPDNAADGVVGALDAADERVLVQQVTVDSRENRLLRAALRAADRGVTVRIHLAGAWYVEEDNAALVAWLNRRADAESWDLEARVDDAGGYEKLHTKGVVVDDTVLLGSLNWGRSAARKNREVVVALRGGEVAGYYAAVFRDDWSESVERPLPVGVLGAVAVALAGGLLVARRIRLVGREGVMTDWKG